MPCREPIIIHLRLATSRHKSAQLIDSSSDQGLSFRQQQRRKRRVAEMRGPESEQMPLLWSAPSQAPAVVQNPPHERPRTTRFHWPSFYTESLATTDLEQQPPPTRPPLPPSALKDLSGNDAHAQFCLLTGCPPSTPGAKPKFAVPRKSLYGRATTELSYQRRAYNFGASLNNILLLSQVILGAALTALGASASSHLLITLFGATNTIIAGLVAYLKSRGQPMRARMYRDDLERVVDEVENSEVMWRGIADGVHGYKDIDTDEVTVRSEVARLTRLYERAVRLNGLNNPDMYMAGSGGYDQSASSGLRGGNTRSGAGLGNATIAVPAAIPVAPQITVNAGPAIPAAVPAVTAPSQEPTDTDVSPATAATAKKDEKKAESRKEDTKTAPADRVPNAASPSLKSALRAPEGTTKPLEPASKPAPAPSPNPELALSQSTLNMTAGRDPDASPATAANVGNMKSREGGKTRELDEHKKVAGDAED